MSNYMNAYEFHRRRAGLSQIEAANALNVAQTTISMWENGKGHPTVERLIEVARLYHCTPNDLLHQGAYRIVPKPNKE